MAVRDGRRGGGDKERENLNERKRKERSGKERKGKEARGRAKKGTRQNIGEDTAEGKEKQRGRFEEKEWKEN